MNTSWLPRLVWLYFWLLIFEGALRKWVLPGLSNPLLIVRDPVAIAILWMAWRQGLLPSNRYVIGGVVVALAGIATAVLFGHGNLFVAIYGARILLLHFPLIFVIPRVFPAREVLRLGLVMLVLAVPMTILIGFQFYSPQSAWVNRGLAGDMEGAGFSGALGFYRPPGTFAFINGLSLFYGMLAPFVVFFALRATGRLRVLWPVAAAALLLAIPLSISRTLFYQVALTLAFTAIVLARKPGNLLPMVAVVLVVGASFAVARTQPVFRTASEAFSARFEMATEHEGGVKGSLMGRIVGEMTLTAKDAMRHPIFGVGQGMGTNVGAQLLGGGRTFLVSESEWGRLIGEMGVILGGILIVIRAVLAWILLRFSYGELAQGNVLPWLLASFAFLLILQGQWAQPTSLGFTVLSGGLTLAARTPPRNKLTVSRDAGRSFTRSATPAALPSPASA